MRCGDGIHSGACSAVISISCRYVIYCGNINWFYIEKKNNATPDENKMYYDSGMPSLRYHSPFEFSTADVFFAVDNPMSSGTAPMPLHPIQAGIGPWRIIPPRLSIPHVISLFVAAAPCYHGTFTVPQYANMIPTDLYYASIDSPLYSQTGLHDWDNDDNGFYGLVGRRQSDGIDFTADISVGRAPVRDRQQAKDYVDKVLTYDSSAIDAPITPGIYSATTAILCSRHLGLGLARRQF